MMASEADRIALDWARRQTVGYAVAEGAPERLPEEDQGGFRVARASNVANTALGPDKA